MKLFLSMAACLLLADAKLPQSTSASFGGKKWYLDDAMHPDRFYNEPDVPVSRIRESDDGYYRGHVDGYPVY